VRVLLTATAAVDQRLDGITVFTQSLATHLAASGVDQAALFVSDLESHPSEAVLEDLRVEGLQVYRAALPAPATPSEALDPPGCEAIFSQVLEAYRPDVVHFGNLELLSAGMIEIARRHGIPAIMTLHDFYPICPAVRLLDFGDRKPCPGPDRGRRCGSCLAATGHLARRYRGARRWLLRRWDVKLRRRWGRAFRARFERVVEVVSGLSAAVCPSRFVGEKMSAAGMLQEYDVIPNGSDLEILPPRPAGGGPLVFGLLVHHTATKGSHLLVEAFRRLDRTDCRLELWGSWDPAYLARVRRICGSDKRVAIMGPFSQSSLSEIVTGLDVLVLSSIVPETLSIAVQDGLAAGRPCVVPSETGAAETVGDGRHGLHFEQGDCGALADVLHRLVSEPGLTEALRANVLADSPVLHRSEVAARYSLLYSSVLAGTRS